MQSKGQQLIIIILLARRTHNQDSGLSRIQCIRKLFPEIPVNIVLNLNTTEKNVVPTKDLRENTARNFDDNSCHLC